MNNTDDGRRWLVDFLDDLCWEARRYGHDDLGLDGLGVNYDGSPVDDDEFDGLHFEAVKYADMLWDRGFRFMGEYQ
jgi:hypothetical protein